MASKTIIEFLHFANPTKEQDAVLKAMEVFVSSENQYDFIVLCGAAGTGKTSITAALIGYLNELGKPYKISAPTGRAARILGRCKWKARFPRFSQFSFPRVDYKSTINFSSGSVLSILI